MKETISTKTIIELDRNWTFTALSGNPDTPEDLINRSLPAVVPGCVHTDLMEAGIIDDPYYYLVEKNIQWIGTTDFRYTCNFEVTSDMLDSDHIDLVFDGLDTITEIYLNGKFLAKTADMFCQYCFDAKPSLKTGSNELDITFFSPVHYCFDQQQKHGKLVEPGFGKAPCMFIRKTECNFGGDWAPNLPTCGIWQGVYLQLWQKARIDSVIPLTISADSQKAVLAVNTQLTADNIHDLQLEIILAAPDGSMIRQVTNVNSDTINKEITIVNPSLWWPRGYGNQSLYDLTVALKDTSCKCLLDCWQKKTGLRQVRLNTEKDAAGSKFNIEINGRTIFCKGANFIPDDFFVTRITEADYQRRFEQMIESNINMLRIWGGGFYESDTFYDFADQYGILVWQDFMCGGAALPEHDEMVKLFEAEACYQITRLSPHPSLVLWCGGNESIIYHFERWSGLEKKKYDEFYDTDEDVIKNNLYDKPWGNYYYNNLFPRLIKQIDPSRPYWPSSSYSDSMDINPLDENHGDLHIWKVSKKINYPNYRKYHPRFVSEFGFQSPACFTTLTECMPVEQVDFNTSGMMQRQRYPKWFEKSCGYLLEHFNKPECFDDWIYLMQIHQARAIDCAVGWFRSQFPDCTGMLYWQFNDCWPVHSWSAIDSYNRKKPLYFATKRFFSDRFITIEPCDDTLAVFAHNDTDDLWLDNADLKRIDFTGTLLAKIEFDFSVLPRACSKIFVMDDNFTSPLNKSCELLYITNGITSDTWFFDIDKRLDYPRPDFGRKLKKTASGYELTVTARSLLRDIVLTPDRVDPKASVSDSMITLIPGQSFTFIITSQQKLVLMDLCRYPVFWCANKFGKKKIGFKEAATFARPISGIIKR